MRWGRLIRDKCRTAALWRQRGRFDVGPFFEGTTSLSNGRLKIFCMLAYVVKVSRNWVFNVMVTWGFII